MLFNEREQKVAEDLAWKMLDGWNHAYMPNLEDYVYFYYKGQIVFDPWMNEKSQGLLWPDHESEGAAVDPVKYYGTNTVENYIVNLFLCRPEWAPEITKKVKGHLNEEGRLTFETTIMPIEVYVAMSTEQAEEERGYTCIESELPDSSRIYFDMVKLPPELVVVETNDWEKEVVFLKRDAKKVFNLLYPNGIKFDYKKKLNRIRGNEVRLIGWGD